MTFLILFGWLVIGSAGMLAGWGNCAWQFRHDQPLLWSKRFMIAAMLSLHAVAMTGASAYRAIDLWHHHESGGSIPWLFATMVLSLVASKAGLIWAASIDEQARIIRWPWKLFLTACLGWAVVAGVWA